MDATRFDTLARSLAETRSRRGALRGLLLGTGSLVTLTAAQNAAAKNCRKIKNPKRRRQCLAKKKPPTCPAASQCGDGCCAADSCFASAVDDQNVEPMGFACCPADKLCRSTTVPYPDQCCYPDETCKPSLVTTGGESLCCRPCGNTCCPQFNQECIEGTCQQVDTARLARTRRPG